MRKAKAKQGRLTLAKAIAKETSIGRKWSVALGQAFGGNFEPESKLELQSLVTKWRTYGLLKKSDQDSLRDPRIVFARENPSALRQAMLEEFAELGYLAAMAIMDGNHKFFSRLAAMVQFDKKPDTHKLYAGILDICYCSSSGTMKRPCDAKLLQARLEKRGHKFNSDHTNQIPPALRAVCKKLGVILSSKGRGRPRNNSRR